MKEKTPAKQFYKHKIANFLNVQKIVTIHYQEPDKNYVSVEESHNFWEINYADKKDVYVYLDGEKHHIKQGEMLFISPNRPHYLECSGNDANIFIISLTAVAKAWRFSPIKSTSFPKSTAIFCKTL